MVNPRFLCCHDEPKTLWWQAIILYSILIGDLHIPQRSTQRLAQFQLRVR